MIVSFNCQARLNARFIVKVSLSLYMTLLKWINISYKKFIVTWRWNVLWKVALGETLDTEIKRYIQRLRENVTKSLSLSFRQPLKAIYSYSIMTILCWLNTVGMCVSRSIGLAHSWREWATWRGKLQQRPMLNFLIISSGE